MELVDLVDERGAVVEVVTRAEMRSRGAAVRHRAVYVAVITSGGALVVHQRADWKDVYPSWWDVCFGGVVAAGEEWERAARRELAEEAGVVAPLHDAGGGPWETEGAALLGRVFWTVHDGPFSCPDGEVARVDTVPFADLTAWLTGRDVCPDSVALVVPRLPVDPARALEEHGRDRDHPAAGEPGQGG